MDPASDFVLFTYPGDFKDGIVQVWATDGRLVLTRSLFGELAGVEVDVKALPVGLYMAALSMDGLRIAETKFSVIR